MLGAPPSQNPDLDESRIFLALLALKKGGAPIKKKEKKVKNKKYILMNPAPLRSAPSSRLTRCTRPLRNYPPRGAPSARLKEEEDKPHTWSHYPPLPPIFCENTTVYVRTGPSTWAFIVMIAESDRVKESQRGPKRVKERHRVA